MYLRLTLLEAREAAKSKGRLSIQTAQHFKAASVTLQGEEADKDAFNILQ
jgi:hypothetical protein